MKNLLIATTALVATAGMASAEITFSGKGEAGMYRTGKSAGVAAKSVAADNTSGVYAYVDDVLTLDADGEAEEVGTAEADQLAVDAARNAYNAAQDVDTLGDLNVALAAQALNAANRAHQAAVAAVEASDMVAYSGYDMNVAMSAETDSGIVFGMGFDMGAGFIADQDDDRAMDAQGAEIATSALTATMNGYTLSIGSDKLDDTYDDTQNGDIGLSGTVGTISFNLVHDLTDEVAAVAATQNTYAATIATSAVAGEAINTAELSSYTAGTAAVAATVETTSLSLGGALGNGLSFTFAATTGDDRGDAAAKGSVTYTGVENLSLTLAHDNVGKLEGISKVTAAYTMGSLTATVSMADDKNHAGNTNKNGKASTNLSLAYAANGLAATFATDESSQWWVNTQYDLGGGAQAFATVDHTEFAVVGVNFAF